MRDLFWNKDFEARKRWDPMLTEFKRVEAVNDTLEIMQSTYGAGVPLVSDRVFVIARTFWPVQNGIHYVGSSINFEKAVQDPNAVRGTSTVFFEWIADGDNLKVTQYLSANPRGSLPSFLINSMKTKESKENMVLIVKKWLILFCRRQSRLQQLESF